MLKYIEGSLSIKNISISAAIIVIFIIISFLVFDYLQDSKFDNYIEKISDALTAVNMNWLMLDSERLEIEKNAKEIWIFQPNLDKDITEKLVQDTVASNLSNNKKYIYFLPDTTQVKTQIRDFKEKFRSFDLDNLVHFVCNKEDEFFVYSEIALYDPKTGREAVEWLPSMDGNDENANVKNQYFIKLAPDVAEKLYYLGDNLIEKERNKKKYESN
jgi:hypothetical protein